MTNTTFSNDTVKTAGDMFTKSMQAGQKMQEETCRFWTDAANRASDDFRNRVEKMAEEAAPMNKKNAERVQKMFDEQTQRNTNFFRNAMEMNPFVRPVSNPTEMFDRTNQFFKASFDTMRDSFEAFGKASQDVVTEWQNVAKRCETGCCTATANVDATRKAAK